MERILHRVNTIERLRRGVEAGFDRLEIDLHHRAGRFLLSHDPPVGPFAVGPVGVEFPRGPWAVVQWCGTFLELPAVLDAKPPPLYIDLKGTWTERALGALTGELRSHARNGDLLGSNRWFHAERLARVAPDRRFVLGVSGRTLPRLTAMLRRGTIPHAVSLQARTVRASGPEIVRRLRGAGAAVYVWDVPRRATLEELERLGAAGVIVDDLTWARARRDAG